MAQLNIHILQGSAATDLNWVDMFVVDILFRSEVSRRQVGKLSNIGSEFSCFGAQILREWHP